MGPRGVKEQRGGGHPGTGLAWAVARGIMVCPDVCRVTVDRTERPGREERGGPTMKNAERSYVVGEDGTRTAVIVDIEQYEKLLEAAEELEAVRAYDAARASGEKPVPFEEAVGEIEGRGR